MKGLSEVQMTDLAGNAWPGTNRPDCGMGLSQDDFCVNNVDNKLICFVLFCWLVISERWTMCQRVLQITMGQESSQESRVRWNFTTTTTISYEDESESIYLSESGLGESILTTWVHFSWWCFVFFPDIPYHNPHRFSSTVCLVVVLAMIFELQYKTDSESEQEDSAINLASLPTTCHWVIDMIFSFIYCLFDMIWVWKSPQVLSSLTSWLTELPNVQANMERNWPSRILRRW